MITFYTDGECRECARLGATLDALCLAHRTIMASGPEGARPPVLVDDGVVYAGAPAVEAHLEELARYKALWDKYQTDACYCGDDGEVE